MKRYFITFSAFAIIFTMFAQEQIVKKNSNVNNIEFEKTVTQPAKAEYGFIDACDQIINPGRVLKSYYQRPEGTLIPSKIMDPERLLYTYKGNIFFGSAFTKPWKFRNFSTDAETYQWYWFSELWSEDEEAEFYFDYDVPYLKPYYRYQHPKLRAYFGAAYNEYNAKTVDPEFDGLFSSGGNMWVSRADFYINTATESNNGRSSWIFTLEGSQKIVNPAENGYFFGSSYYPVLNSRISEIMTFYEKPISPMMIKDVTYHCAHDYSPPLPLDNELRVVAYKLNKQVTVDTLGIERTRWVLNYDDDTDEITNEIIAQGSIFGSDVLFEPEAPQNCFLQFKFFETDPITGLSKETYLVVEDAFALVLYGVGQDGNDFGVVSDRDNQLEASAYFTFRRMNDGRLMRRDNGTVAEYTTAGGNTNIYLMLNAFFPFLYIEPGNEILEVPVIGGVAVSLNGEQGAKFNSEFDFFEEVALSQEEFVWYKGPDWLTITTSSVYVPVTGGEILDHLKLNITALGLNENEEGRVGIINVGTYGHEITFTIKQGVIPEYNVIFEVYGEGEEPIDDATIIFDGVELDGYSTTSIEGTFSYSVSKEDYETYYGEVLVDGDVLVTVDLTAVGIYTKATPILKLYPNPFTNEININNPALVKNVQIMNLAGQSVKGTSLKGNSISTVELTNGVYFVIIETITGEKSVHKMIKR